MSTLNINTLNDIILKAAKDEESKVKIVEAEIEMTADIFMFEVSILLDELEKKRL